MKSISGRAVGCAAALLELVFLPAVSFGAEPAWKPRDKIAVHHLDPAAQPKVIYGTDDRIDVYQETDPDRLRWAASTCGLVNASDLTDNGNGTFTLRTSPYRVGGVGPCEGEPFANQPVAPFCSGFVAGPDIIVTAGHCINSASQLGGIRFIFGFQMLNATTPVTDLAASRVYRGVEIVALETGRSGSTRDYAVIRVDRPITAPGAAVLDIRRSGVVPPGARVGVIGHPTGLPLKIAFGDATTVRDSSHPDFFVANLDTYAGNSGSPVFNAVTGLVEGILVRGETDFVVQGGCFRSNVFPNTGGMGEEVSKTTQFAGHLASSRGQILFDHQAYGCNALLTIFVADADLHGTGTVNVMVVTDNGDDEAVALAESTPGNFTGSISLMPGPRITDNGALEVSHGELITGVYTDAADDTGGPSLATAEAVVDCVPPVISNVAVESAGGAVAVVTFETDEPALGEVNAGQVCDAFTNAGSDALTTSHRVSVGGLLPMTTYRFEVTAEDLAGNRTTDNNEGPCYTFTTTTARDYFTEGFFNFTADIVNTSVVFRPSGPGSYTGCTVRNVVDFPTPACGRQLSLLDDDFERIPLQDGKTFPFFGAAYGELFVGSNGYITFESGDTQYDPNFVAHFSLPRVAPYFSDIDPPSGGRILFAQLEDRAVVTFRNVFDIAGDMQSFQVELFFDGTIRMTWLILTRPVGVVGLSPGGGFPPDFEPSDLSAYPACVGLPYGPGQCVPEPMSCFSAGPPFHPTVSGHAGEILILVLAWAGLFTARRMQS